MVAHRYGVGGAYTFNSEIAFYFAVDKLVIGGAYDIPTACVFDYRSFHVANIGKICDRMNESEQFILTI